MLNLYLFSLILSSFAGIIGFRSSNFSFRLLILFVWYSLFNEWFVHYGGFVEYNHIFYWIYASITTGLQLGAIATSLRSAFARKGLLIFSIVISLVGIGYLLTADSAGFPSTYLVLTIPTIVLACLYFFYELLQQPATEPLKRQPLFITFVALFIYACVGFSYLGCKHFVIESEVGRQFSDTVHSLVTMLFYLTLGYSFLLSRWNNKNVSSST
ncbi:MAG: hypothetical protein ACPGWM_08715 [Flavobacteriales bacterium]